MNNIRLSSLIATTGVGFKTSGGTGLGVQDVIRRLLYDFTYGTGSGQINRIAHQIQGVTSLTPLALDLRGSMVDIFGDAFTIGTLKHLVVINDGNVAVALSSTIAALPLTAVPIPAGGALSIVSAGGWAVPSGVLTLTTGSSSSVAVIIAGVAP